MNRLTAQLCATLPLLALALAAPSASAQTAGAAPRDEIVVIGVSPLPGTGIDPDTFPADTEILSAGDIAREGQASVIRAIDDTLGGVNINDDLDDPFQPDILYHGFTASPVLGTSEGLAIYQNGVRINEAFGGNVNWDLLPPAAIHRLTVIGSNPVFGLNALGGAITIDMKTGFTDRGAEAELSGGAFGQRNLSLQYGYAQDGWAFYAAARALDEDGWRKFSPDSVRQVYADVARRGEDYRVDLSFTGANNLLQGEGATPVQELAVSRALVFTSPQSFRNQLEFGTANGAYDAGDTLTLQANAYYREFRQTIANGNATGYAACATGGGLCDGSGNPAIGRGGMQLPDISDGGAIPLGENDQTATRTVGLGGSLEATATGDLFAHGNHLTTGISFDHAATDYQAVAELGTVSPQLVIAASGLFVDEPDTANGPSGLRTTNTDYGFYLTDTFNLSPDLALTASGRYNIAQTRLMDRLGTALDGAAQYTRFNPAFGATYKIESGVTVYAGYSESNRAPTAGEIACSNPSRPCILPAFLSSDPPGLRQVVGRTVEAGIRGAFSLPDRVSGRFGWKIGFYRTALDDDIIAVTTPASINQGYFQNAGKTRRQGLDASLTYRDGSWSFYANYSLVDATFQSPLQLSSGSPAADANGNIAVKPGDRLPGIPEHRIKLGADYRIDSAWRVGATLNYASAQFYANDQSNQEPKLPGHTVVNIHTTYDVSDAVVIFGELDNAFDAHYGTYAIFGDPTGVRAPGVPANASLVDPRFTSPAPPLGLVAGIRVKL